MSQDYLKYGHQLVTEEEKIERLEITTFRKGMLLHALKTGTQVMAQGTTQMAISATVYQHARRNKIILKVITRKYILVDPFTGHSKVVFGVKVWRPDGKKGLTP